MLNLSTRSTTLTVACLLPLVVACTPLAKLGVGPNLADPGTRTMSLQLTDAQLAQAIRKDVFQSVPRANETRLLITSFYRAILILGEAPDDATKLAITEAAKRYEDVLIVHNEMTVGPVRGVGGRISDELLERKVATNLLLADNVRSSRSRVLVSDGAVYLMGRLTEAEADRAVQRIQGLDGVTRIIKIIDIVPEEANAPGPRQPITAPTPAGDSAPLASPPL